MCCNVLYCGKEIISFKILKFYVWFFFYNKKKYLYDLFDLDIFNFYLFLKKDKK